MNLLTDTNIILEILLDQDKSQEAKKLLAQSADHVFYLSDFSLHSIGVYLVNRKLPDLFTRFLEDMVYNDWLMVISIPVDEIGSVVAATADLNLDFDDAYQYTLAGKYGLTIISFDKDFDRTPLGRKTPAQVLAETA